MDSASAAAHAQVVNPDVAGTSQHRLRLTAITCWKLFERCTELSSPHLSRNYGKFKVWCGNLGVRQGGHASLDWQLKDDEVMENEVFSMLTDLEDDLHQSEFGGSAMPFFNVLTYVCASSRASIRNEATI